MPNNSVKQGIAFLLFCFLPGSLAFSQTASVSLSAGSAVEGGTVPLNLTLSGSGAPAGLQWAFSFVSSDVSSLAVTAGPALATAGKTLNCNSVSGLVTCLTDGLNDSTIGNCVVATVTVTLSPATSGATVPIVVSNPIAAFANGSSETIAATSGTITVTNWQPGLSSLVCSPTSLTSGVSSACTVTLAQAAPSGGTAVSLSSNSTTLPVAASVTVPASSTSATFTATAGTITANQTATLTATLNGVSKTAGIGLAAAVQVSSLTCSPASLGSSSTSTCTVTLTQSAPAGGASVTLSSNAAALTVPASVTVAAGSATATFSATSGTISSSQTATVTVTYNSTSATASISLTAPVQVSSLSCSPTSLGSNSSSTCTVTLTQAAPAGGASVALSSNAAALTVPASVTVAAGSLTTTFSATSGTVSANQTATVTATYNSTSATASISLTASGTTSSLSLSSGSVLEGGSLSLNLTLNGSGGAPAGLQWTFSFVPSDAASVVVAAGAALGSANKTLTCNSVSGSVTCLTAGMNDSTIANGVVATVTVTLSPATSGATVPIVVSNPAATFANGSAETIAATSGTITVTNWQPGLSSLACSPTSLTSGAKSTCTVTLAQAAPSGGTAVSLSSNSTTLPVAASVTIPAGSTSATFTATAGTITANQTATLTATLNGVAKTASISLAAAVQISSLRCSPASLGSNSSSTCTVTLNQAAPAGGASVALSSNATALTVPSKVTVAAGSATATFSATSGTISSSQTATVTATYNSTSATASVALSASTFVSSLSCSPATLTSATSATCTVTAANGSQGQATLTSNNPLLTLPATVTLRLRRGALTASFTATAGQITASQTAIVTATMNGTARSTTVTLNASTQQTQSLVRLLALSCAPNALAAQSTGLCSITLGTVTEAATAQVRLSSSSAALQLPAVIATRPGQTSVQFQINSAANVEDETAVISAQLNANTIEQTVSLRRSHDLAVGVPASQVVKFGSELRFQVSAGDQSAVVAAGPLPAGARFDGSTSVFDWTPSAAQQGKYRLAFTATNSAGESGTAYSSVQVDAGEPAVDRVVNAASGSVQGACSPGSIARIEGRWLTQGETASDPSGVSLALAGTSVEIEGKSVPILYSSPSRIDILCPEAGPASSFEMVVRTSGSVSQPFETMQNSVAPGIFTVDGDGSGQGLVSLAGESKLAMVRNYLSAAEPARPGDRIAILATGIGAASNVLVQIGEAEFPAESVAAVAGRPGISQIVATVPDDAAAGTSILLSIVGQLPDGSPVRSNSVSMAIEEK
jgi:trimeric autotransporter adhesin